MTKINEVYKCNICGNIVEMTHTGAGALICCGQKMELQTEKNQDEGSEKHIPVIEKTETGIKVKVGSVAHPMEEEHYIEWIEVLVDGNSYKQFLKPGQAAEAEFCVTGENIVVREYCNLHGLWKK